MSRRTRLQPLDHEYWFPWETAIWRGDSRLNRCGALARGVWLEAIMCMREGKPGGYLTDPETGKPFDVDDMASAFRLPRHEVEAGLDELRRRGVFSVRGDGAIFCRKIVRQMAISEARSSASRSRSPSSNQVVGDFGTTKDAPNGTSKTQQNVRSKIYDLRSGSSSGEEREEGAEVVTTTEDSLKRARAVLVALQCWKPDHRLALRWSDAILRGWSEDIEQINRVDGRSWERIDAVIAYLPSSWWAKNIFHNQAGRALREHFDRLESEMVERKNKPAAKPTERDKAEEVIDACGGMPEGWE